MAELYEPPEARAAIAKAARLRGQYATAVEVVQRDRSLNRDEKRQRLQMLHVAHQQNMDDLRRRRHQAHREASRQAVRDLAADDAATPSAQRLDLYQQNLERALAMDVDDLIRSYDMAELIQNHIGMRAVAVAAMTKRGPCPTTRLRTWWPASPRPASPTAPEAAATGSRKRRWPGSGCKTSNPGNARTIWRPMRRSAWPAPQRSPTTPDVRTPTRRPAMTSPSSTTAAPAGPGRQAEAVNRQPHDPSLKAQARQVYEAHGSRKAAEATGISRRTINAWARADGWQPPGNRPHLRVAPVADADGPSGKSEGAAGNRVPASWGLASRVLLRRLADTAALALDQVERELAAGHTSKARDAMVVGGIAIQRGLELSKATGPDQTQGHPDAAESAARIAEMARELTARRTGSDGQPS
jgi:hypothetical protein